MTVDGHARHRATIAQLAYNLGWTWACSCGACGYARPEWRWARSEAFAHLLRVHHRPASTTSACQCGWAVETSWLATRQEHLLAVQADDIDLPAGRPR